MTDQSWRYDPGGALCWPTILPPNSEPGRRDPPDQHPATWAAAPETRRFRVARHRVDIPLANGVMFPLSSRRPPRRSAPSNFKEHATKKRRYTRDDPSSEAAEPSAASGMRDDDFNIRVMKAKAENLARGNPRLPMYHQVANYRALVQHVDLLNPELSEIERKRRAKRLVQAYERVRARKRDFHDHSKQLLAAFSIMNKVKYQRRNAAKAKAEATETAKLAM
jgi:hypothetical protein